MSDITKQYFFMINAIMFQVCWWSAVLWQNAAIPLLVLMLALHLWLSPTRKADLILMSKVSAAGIVMDTILTVLGVFQFAQIPIWLALLWLCFAMSLPHSLLFLKAFPPVFTFAFGSVFGCLSYLAGANFNAVNLPLGWQMSSAILMLCWGCFLLWSVAQTRRLQYD